MSHRSLIVCLAYLLSLWSGMLGIAAVPSVIPSASRALVRTLDVPDPVNSSGLVSDFTRVNTVLYWHGAGSCYNPPRIAPRATDSVPGDTPEQINRVSTIGDSPDRQLYFKDLRATNGCGHQLFSRIVADQNWVYWVDATGLVKLSKNANPGDTPTVVSSEFNDLQPYQIAIGAQDIYLSRAGYTPPCKVLCFTNHALMVKVDKTTGTSTGLDCTFSIGCPYGVTMKVDPAEHYLYYIDTSSNLQRMDLGNPTQITQLATAVHSYALSACLVTQATFACLPSAFANFVFIGRGSTNAGQTHEIVRYNNTTNSAVSIYTSADTSDSVSINDLTVGGSNIYFFEVRSNPCTPGPCFSSNTGWLYRSGSSNASGLANIYQTTSSTAFNIAQSYGLDTDGTKLYWIEHGDIQRLSNAASALPQSPMHAVSMEVTQGVQDINNSVPLIRGKRTFVRLYVASDDHTRDVPGVTARLRAIWTRGQGVRLGDWIYPSNVLAITVKRVPSRSQLNDALFFELPWEWVSGDNLQLTAELNPSHNPEQSDNYVRNSIQAGPFHLNAAPRLEVRLFEYYYAMGGTVFGPAYSEKFANIDWIRRAYPMDESNGNMQTPGGGVRWSWTTVRDDALANLVRYPSVPCEDKDTTPAASQNPKLPDCQNLRASAYVASQIAGMRDDLRKYGDTDDTSYYGMIAQGSEQRGSPPSTATYFPRGQDGAKNAAGPAGPGFLGFYAGHEVGHSVGLGHPATAGNECGIEGNDALPTYPHGDIGSDDDASNVEGFLDTLSYNYPRYDNSSLALGSQTKDVMAYCQPEWISDQNYKRIYQNLAGAAPLHISSATQTNGDWLVVYGSIDDGTNTATMDYLRHTVGSVTVPPRTPGDYALRLRDASGTLLQEFAFTATDDNDASLRSYGLAVPFISGTHMVEIVRLGDQQVLASTLASAHPPVVSAVTLPGASDPVTGTITLTWSGSDDDGDTLQYDVFYSRDNGASFQPLIMHHPTTSTSIDTTALGGGTGVFRVIASDGVNTGSADSAPFTMVSKLPTPMITLPSHTISARYGQVVNFSGSAVDAQDGMMDDSALMWTFAGTVIGTGPQITQQRLPPGADIVTLTATNSTGLAASTSVTVNVDDSIDPDGPTMQVGPGAVTWNINSDSTAMQTQQLSVSNFGTGSLTWQVSSNAAWLTVSKTSGNADDTVTITGDPSDLHDGETASAHLTFTTTSNGAIQTVVVPVQLIKGDIYQNTYTGPQPADAPPADAPPTRPIYLPLLGK